MYILNKSDKFSTRFFSISSTGPDCLPCLHLFVPNEARSYDNKSLPKKFIEMHLELRTVCYKNLVESKLADPRSLSAL